MQKISSSKQKAAGIHHKYVQIDTKQTNCSCDGSFQIVSWYTFQNCHAPFYIEGFDDIEMC